MRNDCVIVGFMGLKRAGKSTSAEYLTRHYAYSQMAFADPLYDAIDAMFGIKSRSPFWQNQKDTRIVAGTGKTLRQLLQTLGIEWGCDLVHPDVWVHVLEMRARGLVADLKAATNLKACIAISDVRMKNEIGWVKQNGVLVHVTAASSHATDEHRSENEIDAASADFAIDNSGSKAALYKQLDAIMQTFYSV